MDLLQFLFFVWNGVYGHIVNAIKQVLFKDKITWSNLKDIKWVASITGLAVVAQGSWLLDGVIRQRLKLSEMYGYSSLISAPISAITLIIILKYSEQNLSDKINWVGVSVWIVGLIISMIGSQWMMSK